MQGGYKTTEADMEFLYFLERLRTPFLDKLFSFITMLGEETVFLAFALIIIWCVNKREGYYILTVGLFGIVVNQAVKLICRIPRPWVVDSDFSIVESARKEATGYSFPSGHTQNATGTYGSVVAFSARKWVRALFSTLVLLIAFSRMYLGVHTPADVLFSLGFGVLLVLALKPVFETELRFEKLMPFILSAGFAVTVLFSIFAFSLSESGIDLRNLESARENAATLLGCTGALLIVFFADKYFIRFKTEASWYAQCIKFVLGLAAVLFLKAALKSAFAASFENQYLARCIRYFIIVIFAGIVWPLCFRFIDRIRISAFDKTGSERSA